MAREDLFSKLNIKDYNNKLEIILENKPFSEGAKNILLNILYKIETAYEDYKKVKVYVDSKKELLEQIISNIENNCHEIELIKPMLDEETKLKDKKYIVEKEKGKIISYPNEKNVFYALNHLNNNLYVLNPKTIFLKEPMEMLLNKGYVMNREEIIRDFDGWTWNILSNEIGNYSYNIVYQNIRILFGNEFLQKNNAIDFMAYFQVKLKEKFDIEKLIYQIAILEYIKDNQSKKKNILDIKNELKKDLEQLENKKEYLQKIATSKKLIGKDIKKIDEIINNTKHLRENFIKENENLEESNKIFSLSEYTEILQKRRNELLQKLDEYSELMKPMNFVKKKEEISNEYEILNGINFEINIEDEEYRLLIDLQKNFLVLFNENLKNIQSKKEIIEYIYLFRYYKLIYINENEQMKDIQELEEVIRESEKHLITKACKLKAINILCKNIEENYKLVSKILSYNIIELEDVNLELKKENNNIILAIYDDDAIEDTIICNENEELNVKFNKKIKLFG